MSKHSIKYILLILILAMFVTAFAISTQDGDKVAFFSDIVIPKDQMLNGTVIAIFGHVNVDGSVRGDAVALFGNVTVNGTVQGSAVSVVGFVRINNSGIVYGDGVGLGGGIARDPGAVIKGEAVDINIGLGRHNFAPVITIILAILMVLSYLLSILIILIIPDRIKYMASKGLEHIGRRFGIGILAYILFPIIIVALTITIIGVIIIPFFIIAFMLAAFIGVIPIAIAISQRLVTSINNSSIYIHLLIGYIILLLLSLIPVIGWLIFMFITITALGALVDTKFGTNPVKKQV